MSLHHWSDKQLLLSACDFPSSDSEMVFCHISTDLKERALWLLEHDYIPEDVCETLGISWSSIYHWKCNQAEYGDVVPSQNPLQGRPCLLTADRTEGLISTLCDSPEMYLDEIQDWVAVTHDTGISQAGLHALIRDAGITYKMLQKAASEQDEEARQQWQEFVHENQWSLQLMSQARMTGRSSGNMDMLPMVSVPPSMQILCMVNTTVFWLQWA